MQDLDQTLLVGVVAFELALVVDFVEQHEAEVASGPALVGFEEEHGAIGEDVARGSIVGGLDVAGGNDAELLVGFVELAFGDSGMKVLGRFGGLSEWFALRFCNHLWGIWATYFSFWRAMVLAILFAMVLDLLGFDQAAKYPGEC